MPQERVHSSPVAFHGELLNFEESTIIFAISRSQAKSAALRSAQGANFNVKFTDFRIRRAREYDGVYRAGLENRCLTPEYLQGLGNV
jgi:hypothetical protein